MVPWIAGAAMRVYTAIFGSHAARFHLTRILAAEAEVSRYREIMEHDGGDDDGDDDDDDEDDQPRRRRRVKLRPEWGRIARAAWRRIDEQQQ